MYIYIYNNKYLLHIAITNPSAPNYYRPWFDFHSRFPLESVVVNGIPWIMLKTTPAMHMVYINSDPNNQTVGLLNMGFNP